MFPSHKVVLEPGLDLAVQIPARNNGRGIRGQDMKGGKGGKGERGWLVLPGVESNIAFPSLCVIQSKR